MNFLEINRICPLTMLLKRTKFVKLMCDSFLQIFLTMLKWTHIHTHTNTHLHGSDAISEQVVRILVCLLFNWYDDLSPTVRNADQNFFIHSMLNRRWGLISCDLKLGIMSSEKPTTCIIEANYVFFKIPWKCTIIWHKIELQISSATLRQEIENVVE